MPLHCTHGSIYHCVTSYAAAAAVATAQVYQPSPPIQYGEKRCHSRHECSYCYYFSVFFCCIVRDINSPCINAELLLRVIGGKIHTAGALCCDMRQCTAGRHANMGSERDGEEKINRVRLNYAANKTIFLYFRVFFFFFSTDKYAVLSARREFWFRLNDDIEKMFFFFILCQLFR